MEGKFDSLEQLFPGVHHRDANAVQRSPPQQSPEWAGGTGRWRVSNPSRVADRRRRGVVARHTLRWPGRSACQHVGYGGHHHHRCRARRIERRCARPRRGRGGTDHHRLVGRISVTVPQPGDSLGGGVGATRRGRQASAAGPSSNATFGLGRPQAAGVQAADRRAQAGEKAAVDRRVIAVQRPISARRNRQELVNRSCTWSTAITTQSESCCTLCVNPCTVTASRVHDNPGVEHGYQPDAARSHPPRPSDQRQRQS